MISIYKGEGIFFEINFMLVALCVCWSKVDPAFAGIISTLQETDDLSDKCREMLVHLHMSPTASCW